MTQETHFFGSTFYDNLHQKTQLIIARQLSPQLTGMGLFEFLNIEQIDTPHA